MTIKVIARKISEPELPYLHIVRENLNQSFDAAFTQNKKCLYITGITGYGKTTSVRSYFEYNQEALKVWYLLDEWDKDPVTFLNYLYQIFLKKEMISDDLLELLSQPLNNEKQIKNFIALLSNELDTNLIKDTFLVIDNFHEVQNEEIIQQIIIFMLNYCPEKLKIILISQETIPEIFYPFFLRHEIELINTKDLFLNEKESDELIQKIGKNNISLSNKILSVSQKNISLFILMAQKIDDKESLDNYNNNKMLKTSLDFITSQIYKSLDTQIIHFINQILFLPKIIKNVSSKSPKGAPSLQEQTFLQNYINSGINPGSKEFGGIPEGILNTNKTFEYNLKILSEEGIIIFNQNEESYSFNSVFTQFLTENFFFLSEFVGYLRGKPAEYISPTELLY